MAISYNRLWKQLIDHGLSKTDMMHRAKISTNVLARLSKGEPVSMDSWVDFRAWSFLFGYGGTIVQEQDG